MSQYGSNTAALGIELRSKTGQQDDLGICHSPAIGSKLDSNYFQELIELLSLEAQKSGH